MECKQNEKGFIGEQAFAVHLELHVAKILE